MDKQAGLFISTPLDFKTKRHQYLDLAAKDMMSTSEP
jgi:hypothetical protein